MYEIEFKVELSLQEKNTVTERLQEKDFSCTKKIQQKDYYIEAKESAYKSLGGKYDLKRYRQEGDTCFYTEKSWGKSCEEGRGGRSFS